MATLLCFKEVKALLKSTLCDPNRRALAEYVNAQESAPSWDIFLINRTVLRRKYWQTLIALHRELVPNHISSEDLYSSLWLVFKEVVVNANVYQTGQSLDQKISEFCDEVKKPLQIFDIIYEIKNFDIGNATFNVGTVEIFKLTDDYLQKLGFKKDVSEMQDRIFKEWVGKSVAKTEVSVSDVNRAYESGILIVNRVLNTIRIAAIREAISQDDQMFLWEVGEVLSIPRVQPETGPLWSRSYHRGFRPLIVPMDQTIAKGLGGQGSWQYVLDGNLPEDINTRVTRAIEWISHAITSNSLDYKLVDLCTALEILLLPDHKSGTKGELIALRQVLIGRGESYAPGFVLYLYEKRSKIIHSGTLEIASFSDYWNLKICCLRVLNDIVSLYKRHPDIKRLRDLLKLVENADTLQSFIKQCDGGIYGGVGIDKIKKAAEKQLARMLKG